MTALELFCDIIRSEMGLANDQVWLWDNKINIPTDSRLYVAVSVLSCKPFSNIREEVPNLAGLKEVLYTNMLASLQVDIMSRDASARDRKEEVILALRSTYSQGQQEANGFYVGAISGSFVNLSQVEGAAIPYRFAIQVNIQYKVVKEKQIAYYEHFTKALLTEE